MRTIGDVVQELQADFPTLSISKLRYLEDRGLLAPARSEGRYRKYTAADVRRLRAILTLQRDEYLPLEVIRERLDRFAARGTVAGAAASAAAVGPAAPPVRREEPVYSAKEVCELAGVDTAFLNQLEEYRLIDRPASTTGAVFSESDLETVRLCQLLSRHQLEPRNLRLLGSGTERAAALIEQIATTALRSTHADKREYGVKIVEELGSLFSRLSHLLLYKELRRLL
jgi:DNA-binding transcriptional MerR regulator